MEPSTCLCGAVEDVTRLERRDLLLDGSFAFRVGRCPRCGIERLNPRPTPQSILAFYPFDAESYQPYQHVVTRQPPLRRWDRRYGLHKRLRAIEQYVSGGRLLDVGAASGAFLSEVARAPHWQGEGVELNPAAAETARAQGLSVWAGTLEERAFPDGRFDVVTLWDVFEHLHEPAATLTELWRILRPGGLLVMSVPNLASWDRAIFGRYWNGYELPRHLYLFDPNTARALLTRHGFEGVAVRAFFGSHAYFMTSLQFLLTEKMTDARLRQGVMRAVLSAPARLLAMPYFWVADRLTRTANMTLFARKASRP